MLADIIDNHGFLLLSCFSTDTLSKCDVDTRDTTLKGSQDQF
ncbi:Uncharacterised protein [Klebsiella pneumoniae]|nr:Uncharacterised protein [Klebsiella pneumoniae]